MPDPLDHLLIEGYSRRHDFQSTLRVHKQPPPSRNRARHGRMLLAQLRALAADEAALRQRRVELHLPEGVGTAVALEVSPVGALDYSKQLEWKRDGIEVLTASNAGDREIVVLHVPDGKLSAFEKRIREYLTENVNARKPGQPSKPKNATLINSIADLRRAVFAELWTDELRGLPEEDTEETYQVWLRVKPEGPVATYAQFVADAEQFHLHVETGYVPFPGRIVIAVRSTRRQLQNALELLDLIAEIRSVPPLSEFFLGLKPFEQAEWVRNLQERLILPGANAPYVALLDTGVNNGHPLLAESVDVADLHALDPAWGVTDHEGHGTEMAGLVLHGDVGSALASQGQHVVSIWLESVKILPPEGQNSPHLYGWTAQKATETLEASGPDRLRTFVMMTTSEGDTTGLPSEWSAAIDRLSFGLLDESSAILGEAEAQLEQRLFVLAAGNVPPANWGDYPAQNLLSPVENPGQAWNALTVGACTELTQVDKAEWPTLSPIASSGMLSPCSTTSLLWSRAWPFKPDVVAEGGNGGVDQGNVLVGPRSLRLVTTAHDPARHLLAEAGDTSAAAAEVSNLCGRVQARYPNYWPETIRALVVDGARYNEQMRATLPLVPRKRDKEKLLRTYGYGRINGTNSLTSSYRKPTLVLQETITPYRREGSATKLGELNLHELPWPADALRAIPDVDVALRITLSYFVEPNPSRRGWQSRYRYQSHGLRFAVKGSTESEERFMQRINKLEREAEGDGGEEAAEALNDPDTSQWFLGAQLRGRGSLHSDVWMGTAAQLADKSHVAVFPVGGWWKDWAGAQRLPAVRYSLLVTLEVLADLEIDIYTPIATEIGVPVVV